jgi:hypothetical protein
VRLRVSPKVGARKRELLLRVARGLPDLRGGAISVSISPGLTASRGKLLSGFPHLGTAVHAAAFIRRRRIVLEAILLRKPSCLRLILVHEIFHFVWPRLSNAARREFEALLLQELEAHARGELGESAATQKAKLPVQLGLPSIGKGWRDYVCESFCDTSAWLYGRAKENPEFTLAKRWRATRRRWFVETFSVRRNC